LKRFIPLLLILCLLCTAACAQSISEPATLTAVGIADVENAATRAVLSIEMSAFGETVTQAQSQMDAMLDSLHAALEAQGIEEKSIRSTRYDVRGQYEYHYTKITETDLLIGYDVVVQLETYVADSHDVGAIIDAVNAEGIDCSYDLAYEKIEDPAAYDAALKIAAQDALHKAELMAEACGLELDRMVSIEEAEDVNAAIVRITYTVK